MFSRRALLGRAAGVLSLVGTYKTAQASVKVTVPEKVTFCNWCPDPKNPSPEHHPNGQCSHIPAAVTIPREPTDDDLVATGQALAKVMLPKGIYFGGSLTRQYQEQLRNGYVIPFKFTPPSTESAIMEPIFDWFKHLVLHVERVVPYSVDRFTAKLLRVVLQEALRQHCGYHHKLESYIPVGSRSTVTPRYCKDTDEIVKHGPQMFAEIIWGAANDIIMYLRDNPQAVVADTIVWARREAYMLEFFVGIHRTDGKGGACPRGVAWPESHRQVGPGNVPYEGFDTLENFETKLAEFRNCYGEEPRVLTMTQTGFGYMAKLLGFETKYPVSTVDWCIQIGELIRQKYGLETRQIGFSWNQLNYATLDGAYALTYPKVWEISRDTNGQPWHDQVT